LRAQRGLHGVRHIFFPATVRTQIVALHCGGVAQALKDEAGGRSSRGFGGFVAWAAMSGYWAAPFARYFS
jgi:hypothetical protein